MVDRMKPFAVLKPMATSGGIQRKVLKPEGGKYINRSGGTPRLYTGR